MGVQHLCVRVSDSKAGHQYFHFILGGAFIPNRIHTLDDITDEINPQTSRRCPRRRGRVETCRLDYGYAPEHIIPYPLWLTGPRKRPAPNATTAVLTSISCRLDPPTSP